MAQTNAERQAAWRDRQAENKWRVAKLEEQVRLLTEGPAGFAIDSTLIFERVWPGELAGQITGFIGHHNISVDEWHRLAGLLIDGFWYRIRDTAFGSERERRRLAWKLCEAMGNTAEDIARAMLERPWERRKTRGAKRISEGNAPSVTNSSAEDEKRTYQVKTACGVPLGMTLTLSDAETHRMAAESAKQEARNARRRAFRKLQVAKNTQAD
jgi:hypothetical protein